MQAGLEVGDADVPKGPGDTPYCIQERQVTVQHRELYSASFCFCGCSGSSWLASPLVAVNGGCSRVVVLQLLIVAASLLRRTVSKSRELQELQLAQ